MNIFEDFIAGKKSEDHLISGNKLVLITAVDDNGNNKMECYDSSLTLLWEVTPPVCHFQKGNRFVGVHEFAGEHDMGSSYTVNDFNGVRYWFDLETGGIYDKEFVK